MCVRLSVYWRCPLTVEYFQRPRVWWTTETQAMSLNHISEVLLFDSMLVYLSVGQKTAHEEPDQSVYLVLYFYLFMLNGKLN